MLSETRYKRYIIFNYNDTINKSFYHKDSDNGTKPWFYEPPSYKGKNTFSLGYETEKLCILDASIDEAEVLLKNYNNKLNKIILFFDTLNQLEKDKCISNSGKKEIQQLNRIHSSNMYLMKKLQEKIKEIQEWRTQLKSIEANL